MKIKCDNCGGCMTYKLIENNSYYWCEFCGLWYRRIPGGDLVRLDEQGLSAISKKYKPVQRSQGQDGSGVSEQEADYSV